MEALSRNPSNATKECQQDVSLTDTFTSKVKKSPAYDLSSIGVQTHFVNEANNLTGWDKSEGNAIGAFGGR